MDGLISWDLLEGLTAIDRVPGLELEDIAIAS
jgi:hypothetical protein